MLSLATPVGPLAQLVRCVGSSGQPLGLRVHVE